MTARDVGNVFQGVIVGVLLSMVMFQSLFMIPLAFLFVLSCLVYDRTDWEEKT